MAEPTAVTHETASQTPARLLGALLVSAGIAHFAAPRPFDAIVPRALPGSPRAWTYASGAAELAVGAAVLAPRTRSAGALAAVGLFAAVFPANVKMARDWRHRPAPWRHLATARLPLQLPLALWALHVHRTAR
ncbi:MauE/DoxX family redox-associated membrane protein [Kitasatospora sp. NPDC004745]|uniref:DoxX family protein n=1 Tax=unclassified Kitasatospora TaxID=2633591 RepID=UPI0033D84D5D